MDATKHWSIAVEIDEHDDTTRAQARLETAAGREVRGLGHAQRNPLDASVPEIGDELAVARALRNLADHLLHTTEKDIEGATGEPAHLYR
ncbi:Domain of unknown function DUF1876 [Beutenbergia cavernae DSM 12333]|uniref:DUF1876 domain-containing protein n=1 Tax=Beutenbergia cavernae (strain ATCC BAA-8 / DSM 12333 / CCUG 43141 / JCM 11478 / NBRC 16432 / NCIMB 13614 / HKI 0122) TaxID=471853 RepID=C5BX66_BEUC1|nr:DUF1876 domain-containing protein [Beutenbergia cavernae]ACQ78741.1 Domain of unknown function DUF1876 [Beutenbergia cavernae DSM 12333]